MKCKYLLPMAAAVLCAMSCGDDFKFGGEHPQSLELERNSIDFDSGKGSASLAVHSSSSWSAKSLVDWIAVEKTADSLRLSVEANPDIYFRSGSVKLNGGGTELLLEVNQDALGLDLSIDKKSLTFPWEADTLKVAVVSNVDYSIQYPDWMAVERNEDTLAVSASENYTLIPRSGAVYLSHGEEIIGSLPVSQKAVSPAMTFGRNISQPWEISSAAWQDTLSVHANWTWKVEADPWIEMDLPEAGEDGLLPAGDHVIGLSCSSTKYDRNTQLVFTTNTKVYRQNFVQDGIIVNLSIDKTEAGVKAAGDTVTVVVSASEDWILGELPSWITASRTAADAGDTPVDFVVAQNKGVERSASIKITCYTKSVTLTINQDSEATEYKIVFADGTNVFRSVLTPSLKSSIALGYNLGVKEEALTADPGFKMEFYSRGVTLHSLKDTGIKINPSPGTYSTSKQLRDEDMAYIKFPAIEGKKLIRIEVNSVKGSDRSVYITSAVGPTNEDAIASKVSDDPSTMVKGINIFNLKNPRTDTPYYLFLCESGYEYRIFDITVYYVSE